jgi:uncharacterized protein YdhG (YjbR/CyaY superfamily)
MSDNKTKPTTVNVEDFLVTVSVKRQTEVKTLIDMMQEISGMPPIMWGPSIIGFGTQHYMYDTGREGDMPLISFSPRKASITIYFAEGFDNYGVLLAGLGTYKTSVSCLYVNKLTDINIDVLQQMVEQSYSQGANPIEKPTTVDEYISRVPMASRPKFEELRSLVKAELPNANEVLSYGIIGYKIDDKRARVYISGWKDHVAIYPIPNDEELRDALKPYIKGKGTLWFPLKSALPTELITKTIKALTVVE